MDGIFSSVHGHIRQVKPLPISPLDFLAGADNLDWSTNGLFLRNRVVLGLQNFYAPVRLPQGACVKKLILYGYRSDALATLQLRMQWQDRANGWILMANIIADWTTGYSSGFDDSIIDPMIDNENYAYHVYVTLDPNESIYDVSFTGGLIEWE